MAALQAKLAPAHAKVVSSRSDSLHKLATRLPEWRRSVVVEDLGIAAMTASAKGSGNWRGEAGLNRAVANAGQAELRRQLTCKTKWCGASLVVAERWYPSSKTCSGCGPVPPAGRGPAGQAAYAQGEER